MVFIILLFSGVTGSCVGLSWFPCDKYTDYDCMAPPLHSTKGISFLFSVYTVYSFYLKHL